MIYKIPAKILTVTAKYKQAGREVKPSFLC